MPLNTELRAALVALHADRHPPPVPFPVPFPGQAVGGTVAPLTDWAGPPGATLCPLCPEHLGDACPGGRPRLRPSGESAPNERQYRGGSRLRRPMWMGALR